MRKGATDEHRSQRRLTSSQGLEIPYIGYVELALNVLSNTFKCLSFLVVKDPMFTPVNERKKKIPEILGSNALETFVNTCSRSMGRRSGLAPIQVANFGDKDAYLRAPMTAISCPILKPAATIEENHVLLWEAQSYTLTRENVG